MIPAVAFLSDVEGLWDKLASFCARCPLVRLEGEASRERLVVAPGAIFIFGGDAIDRGPHARRIVRVLLDAKERQPAQVILLAGNRDLNKMRLVRELAGSPPESAPDEVRAAGRGELLAWIFRRTMGAGRALEMRARELEAEGRASSPDAVADSYLEDLEPAGELSRYLVAAQLAARIGPTLFVHGAVSDENFGRVPGEAALLARVDDWVARLNAFYARQLQAFVERRRMASSSREERDYEAVVAYQAPIPGTRENRLSVVYGRPTSRAGAPRMLSRALIDKLAASGVRRVIVGHTPSGDAPAILRARGFELVLTDNSYAPCELDANVVYVREGGDILEGSAFASVEGAREPVRFQTSLGEASALIGRVEIETGRLVKGELAGDRHFLWRVESEGAPEQIAVSSAELARRVLMEPPLGDGDPGA